MENDLNKSILRDFAKSARANRIAKRWADKTAKQFRILDFKTLRNAARASWYWNDALEWQEQDRYKKHCSSLTDEELKVLGNSNH